jgi:hypothetical protein
MNRRLWLSALCLTGAIGLGGGSAGAQGIVSKQAVGNSNYCHMKFESIQQRTLGSRHPALNDSDSNDIVDYYGPCDHDPLGQDEIRAQARDSWRRSIREYGE